MTWLLIILVIAIWFLLGQKKCKKLQKIAKEFPGTIPELPLIGHSYIYLGTDEDRMKAIQKLGKDSIKQGGVSSAWHASQLYLNVSDPVIGDMLLKSCLAKDEYTTRFLRNLFGHGSVLVYARVNMWRPRRKVLATAFSPRNLNGFVEVFAEQSAIMVKLLQPMVGTGDFSIWKYITKYTFDAVSETNLGVKLNSQTQDTHQFQDAVETVTSLVAARLCQPWLYPEFIYSLLPTCWKFRKYVNYIDNFVDEIITEKRKSLDANGHNTEKSTGGTDTKRRTLLEMIMESSGYNDTELREETKVILMAGTDTSAAGAAFTLVLLSRHPDVQETVYKELYEVYGNSDKNVAVEDLPKFKYLEAVIKESMRLYPPVPVVVREVQNDVKLPSGTTLMKGVRVLMNIWGTHRNYRYWGDDVEQFKPERFLEGPLKHPAQFIPFSYGMRNCVGYQYAMMSMKTVLATLLRNYRVLPPVEMDPAHYKNPLRVKYNIMMKHVDNFVVRLENRT